jgi:hypothetical protein
MVTPQPSAGTDAMRCSAGGYKFKSLPLGHHLFPAWGDSTGLLGVSAFASSAEKEGGPDVCVSGELADQRLKFTTNSALFLLYFPANGTLL